MVMLNRHLCVVAIAAVVVTTAAPAAQDNAADTAWLIQVLELRADSIVADIGAGAGELTIAIARHVAPTGRVYTSELGDESLTRLQQAVTAARVANVTVLPGDTDRTNLPEHCCDAVFMRSVYHHFANPQAMNASLWQSLKPGGRLAIIDFAPRGAESLQPDGRATGDRHGVTVNTLANELRQAGFTVVSAEQRPDRSIYVVATKGPERGSAWLNSDNKVPNWFLSRNAQKWRASGRRRRAAHVALRGGDGLGLTTAPATG